MWVDTYETGFIKKMGPGGGVVRGEGIMLPGLEGTSELRDPSSRIPSIRGGGLCRCSHNRLGVASRSIAAALGR